jgi:hypothetical protein
MFIEQVVRTLNKHGVRYALVGGYAVALHGAVRGTVDIDLVIGLDRGQYESTEDALRAIGLQPRLPVNAGEVFSFREEYITNRNLTAWSFYHPDNPVKVVDVLITEDVSQIQTVAKKLNRLRIEVASIPDLIRMKRRSGRPQDLEDIKALEKLQ